MLRISDADREAAVGRLQTALAEGRISLEELEVRLSAVYRAKTADDLQELLADLPPLVRPAPSPVRPKRRWPHFAGALAVIVLLAVIGSATSRDEPSPAPTEHHVLFEVTSAASANVEYGRGYPPDRSAVAKRVWRQEMVYRPGLNDRLSLLVSTETGDNQPATCRISVDGVVLAEKQDTHLVLCWTWPNF